MTEYFPEVDTIEYGGEGTDDDLAFSYYDPDKRIGGKRMEDHLRFSVAYWHSFREGGTDPYSGPTISNPWAGVDDPMERALTRVDAAIEFMEKLGVQYFCIHDRHLAPGGETLAESNTNLDRVVDRIERRMDESGVELLWGMAQLFADRKYIHGTATSPNADVFAHAAARTKKAIDVTERLGGDSVLFWGGRDGYQTLLNTDMERDKDNMAAFMRMAADYADDVGFEGQLLIEPNPRDPMKHQYDADAATVLSFLRKYGLEDRFSLNIEANHANLAGHTFQHELRYARINDALGSVDANQGDKLLDYDTDEAPTDVYATTLAMYEILANDGIAPGGLNFDVDVRLESTDVVDLFHAHVAGMDAFAKGLEVAHAIHEDGAFQSVIDDRYESYEDGVGAAITAQETDFESLAEHAHDTPEVTIESGHQERLEQMLNRYILET